MADRWDDAWEEAIAANDKAYMDLVTLELHHSSFLDDLGNPTAVRAVNNTEDWSFLLEASAPLDPSTTVLFKGIPFDMPWPEIEDQQVPEITIRIDGIGREITQYLDAAVRVRQAITVILRTYKLHKDTGVTTLAHDPISFQMRSVKVDDYIVTGSASPRDLANKRACSYVYNLQEYPGLNAA